MDNLNTPNGYWDLFERTFDAIYLVLSDGSVSACNPSGYKLLGYDPGDDKRLYLWDIENLSKDQVLNRITRILQRGHEKFRTIYRTKLGKLLRIVATANVIHLNGERVIQIIAKDISSALETREDLVRKQNLLIAIIECLPFDFFAIDRGGKYFLQNEVCKIHWGNIIGSRAMDIAPTKEVGIIWEKAHKKALSGETVTATVKYENDKQLKYLRHSISPIRENQVIVGAVGILVDVTEHNLLEHELVEQYRTRCELLNSLEHELRTPLAAIEILATNIASGVYCNDPANCQSRIGPGLSRHAKYVKQVLNQMLIIGRDQAHPETEETQHVDLSKFVEGLSLGPLLPNCIKGGVNLKIRNEPSTIKGLWAQISLTDLTTIVNNLIVNAIEAMGELEYPIITLNIQRDKSHVIIEVRDNGPGVSDNIGPQIFEDGVTTKPKRDGMIKRGSGLATTKSLVSQWNGEIWYTNNQEGGASFFVRIPLLIIRSMTQA